VYKACTHVFLHCTCCKEHSYKFYMLSSARGMSRIFFLILGRNVIVIKRDSINLTWKYLRCVGIDSFFYCRTRWVRISVAPLYFRFFPPSLTGGTCASILSMTLYVPEKNIRAFSQNEQRHVSSTEWLGMSFAPNEQVVLGLLQHLINNYWDNRCI
jgi:hypothetical protein